MIVAAPIAYPDPRNVHPAMRAWIPVELREVDRGAAPICVVRDEPVSFRPYGEHVNANTVVEIGYRRFDDQLWRPAHEIFASWTGGEPKDRWMADVSRGEFQSGVHPLAPGRWQDLRDWTRATGSSFDQEEAAASPMAVLVRARGRRIIVVDGVPHVRSWGPTLAVSMHGRTASVVDGDLKLGGAFSARAFMFSAIDQDLAIDATGRASGKRVESHQATPVRVVDDLPSRIMDFATSAAEAVAWETAWELAHLHANDVSRGEVAALAGLNRALALRGDIEQIVVGRTPTHIWPHDWDETDFRDPADLLDALDPLGPRGLDGTRAGQGLRLLAERPPATTFGVEPASEDDLDALADVAP